MKFYGSLIGILLAYFLSIYFLFFTNVDAGSKIILEDKFISNIWSGHFVDFDFLISPPHQYAAFYNQERKLSLWHRDLASRKEEAITLPEVIEWDSHNYVSLGLDKKGNLHVSANMHSSPLRYYRTSTPGDINSLKEVNYMARVWENQVTYPEFLRRHDGALLFTYRAGVSGAGSQVYLTYDEGQEEWRKNNAHYAIDGELKRNAYPTSPLYGSDGYYHLTWTWRSSPDASSSYYVCYAKSRDLVTWEKSSGEKYDLPIKFSNAEIVDPVPAGGGLINGNVQVGFDSEGNVVITYIKYDEDGNTQIFAARKRDGTWRVSKVTDWHFRWDIRGLGTLNFEVNVFPIVADKKEIKMKFNSLKEGDGIYVLDPDTLKATRREPNDIVFPLPLMAPSFEDGKVHFKRAKLWQYGKASRRYFLRWETAGTHQDLESKKTPAGPISLKLYKISSDED